MTARESHGLGAATFRAEFPLAVITGSATLFLIFGDAWLADLSNPLWLGFMFAWLFAAILWAAIRVVKHADC